MAFDVKGLPLKKRLAVDAFLKRFVTREGRCIDLPHSQKHIQKVTFWIIQGQNRFQLCLAFLYKLFSIFGRWALLFHKAPVQRGNKQLCHFIGITVHICD